MRVRTLALALGALAVAIQHIATHSDLSVGDYNLDARPAIDALSRFDLHAFVQSAPLMGSLTLLLRAPFVAAVHALHGSAALGYGAGALVCMLPLIALAVWALLQMQSRGEPRHARIALGATLALTPFIGAALTYGHPEELLAGALCIVALLLARSGRIGLAGVALGLAVASKQWALVAIAPVLVAAPRRRWEPALIAAAIFAALTLPGALADTRSFAAGAKGIASVNSWVSVVSLWWPLANFHTHFVTDGVQMVHFTTFKLPASLNLIPHPLIVAIGPPLGLLLMRRTARPSLDQLLSLLALLLLLRCVLDPWNNLYYQAPLIVALFARDALCGRGLPIVSIGASVLGWVTFWRLAAPGHELVTFAFYSGWTLALGAWLACHAFAIQLPALARSAPRRDGLSPGTPARAAQAA